MKVQRYTYRALIPFLLLGALSACVREPLPDEDGIDRPVMLSAETKGLPAGMETFRVALFHNNQYSGQSGTYCTLTFSHTDNYTDPSNPPVTYTWLQPCRVNNAGDPLDDTMPDGNIVTLNAADHSSKWGLRWNNGGSSWSGNAYLVAIAPAKSFIWEGHAAYFPWTLDSEVYISDPVNGGFSGIWFQGQYVYTSSSLTEDTSLSRTLVDHRAKITVKIISGTDLIPETYLYDVRVADRITEDRFYLHQEGDHPQGFSRPENDPNNLLGVEYFVVDRVNSLVLKDSSNNPDIGDSSTAVHLTYAGAEAWFSNVPFFLQARNYSDQWMTGKRPTIVVKLGLDASNHVTVRVPIDQELLPMHHYLYTLEVKNAYVAYSFQAVGWDENPAQSTTTETPAYLGTVKIGGPGSGDDVWGNGGGGNADPPVNS